MVNGRYFDVNSTINRKNSPTERPGLSCPISDSNRSLHLVEKKEHNGLLDMEPILGFIKHH